MAEFGPLSKVLQKHAGRAKERFLQNLGKADKTTDEEFDQHVTNFTKQHNTVTRMQKEIKNYYAALTAMNAARKSLLETVNDLYEFNWVGMDDFREKSEVVNKNFDEFLEKINSQILLPVNAYLHQFPELTTKINKRNRKLLDYDKSRHNLQNLEAMKKREEAKISKAKDQNNEAFKNFETLNSELHDELPALYDSRTSFFASHFQCLFIAEAHFHEKDADNWLEACSVMEKLEFNAHVATTNLAPNDQATSADMSGQSDYQSADGTAQAESCFEVEGSRSSAEYHSFSLGKEGSMKAEINSTVAAIKVNKSELPPKKGKKNSSESDKSDGEPNSSDSDEHSPSGSMMTQMLGPIVSTPLESKKRSNDSGSEVAVIQESVTKITPVPNIQTTPIDKPATQSDHHSVKAGSAIQDIGSEDASIAAFTPNVPEISSQLSLEPFNFEILYKVKSTYKYTAEDADELSFDVGDIIDVVAYDDPEEQEDGWLMGVFNKKKGLFPANFTSRL